jgi:predicted Zn-dependent protease
MAGRAPIWLRLVKHPGWALLTVLLLGLSAYLLWQGYRALEYRRALADAKKALGAYDFAAARQSLEQCIGLRPRDPAVRLLAAQAARRDGDLGAAEEQLDTYHTLVGKPSPEETLELAMLKAQRGQVKDVVDYLLSCLEVHHPASEQILEALAVGSINDYLIDQAHFWTEELLEKSPTNMRGRLLHAETLVILGKHDVALELFRKLVNEFPRQTDVRQHLAEELFRAQEFAEAAEQYDELRGQLPGRPAPLLGLSRCWMQMDRIDDAKALLRQLEAQRPDDPLALLECGKNAMREERLADAERLLRRALELAPNDRETNYQLGMCLRLRDQPEESERYMRRVKQIEADMVRLEKVFEATVKSPADPAPRLEAGQICLRNGQDREGLRWLYGLLEIAPDYKPAHEALADYFTSQGDSARADHHRRLAH